MALGPAGPSLNRVRARTIAQAVQTCPQRKTPKPEWRQHRQTSTCGLRRPSSRPPSPGRNQPIITQFPRTVPGCARTSNFPGSRRAGPRLLQPISAARARPARSELCASCLDDQFEKTACTSPHTAWSWGALLARLHAYVCVSTAAPEVPSVLLALLPPHLLLRQDLHLASSLRGPRCPDWRSGNARLGSTRHSCSCSGAPRSLFAPLAALHTAVFRPGITD